jgi:O-antigen/teichoic acid export membrane protein
VGLKVVPIVMLAEMCMGVYFNLSFWYKLTDDTRWGAYFSLIGCSIIIVLNIVLIPYYSYMACAWAGLAGYSTAMLLSYFVGQKKYPIPYDLKAIGGYVALAAVLYAAMCLVPEAWGLVAGLAVKTLLLLAFVAFIVKRDFPLSGLPVVGKYFRV